MVANLSSHKSGWDDRWKEFSDWAEKGHAVMPELLHLVDEDTAAFNQIMNVFAMPKGTDEEKAARSAAIQKATLYATQVPLRTMKASFKAFEVVRAMAERGKPKLRFRRRSGSFGGTKRGARSAAQREDQRGSLATRQRPPSWLPRPMRSRRRQLWKRKRFWTS